MRPSRSTTRLAVPAFPDSYGPRYIRERSSMRCIFSHGPTAWLGSGAVGWPRHVPGFARLLAHASFPAPVVFTSEGLFLAGMGTAMGAYWVAHHRDGTSGRVAAIGFGLAAVGCFSMATVLPFIIGPGSLSRPTPTGQLAIVSPRPAQIFQGDPATVPVSLSLSDATIVPVTTIHVVPNQGHVHLYSTDRSSR